MNVVGNPYQFQYEIESAIHPNSPKSATERTREPYEPVIFVRRNAATRAPRTFERNSVPSFFEEMASSPLGRITRRPVGPLSYFSAHAFCSASVGCFLMSIPGKR